MIDLVDVSEVIIHMHAMLGHHAAHGGAVAPVIIFLDAAGFLGGYAEEARNELADPRIDLLPQIDVMRVQRVVEIEHPGVDVGEGARYRHRSLNSSSLRKQGPIRRGRRNEHTGSCLWLGSASATR